LLRRKINFPQCCLHHLHHQLTLSLSASYGALSKTGSNGLGSEVRASFSLLRFKISKSPDRFAGDIDPDVLRCSVGIADKGSHSSGVEDAIKITTGGLSCIGEFVTGSMDLCAGIVGLLQTFRSFVRLFEQ
jgi:hypothetical protein